MTHYSNGVESYLLSDDDAYAPGEKRFYPLIYRPGTWEAGKEYISGDKYDLVISPVPNGWMYICVSGGISGSTTPSFSTKENGRTKEGTVEWVATPYNLLLRTGDSITTSTWTGTNGETYDGDATELGIRTKFRLTGVPAGATSAEFKNHIVVQLANGENEEFDTSITIPVVDS